MEDSSSEWISFSDIMTTLMLVFLLVSLITINQIEDQFSQIEDQFKDPVVTLLETKEQLYSDLKRSFALKEQELGIEIEQDLTIKFNNIESLFKQDSHSLEQDFSRKLDEFFPLYFSVINKEQYADTIKEVRIEGHTADRSPRHNSNIALIELSQRRANSILTYILDGEYYNQLNEVDQRKLFFWFSANGFGKGRALDETGKFVFDSGQEISPNSRRIEFKVVTTEEELVDEIKNIEQINQ